MQVWSAEYDTPRLDLRESTGHRLGPGLRLHPPVHPGDGTEEHRDQVLPDHRQGPLGEKEPYTRPRPRERAEMHAATSSSIAANSSNSSALSLRDGPPPIVISPYDAELYGHWWYEGPIFLDHLIRKAARNQDVLRLQSPVDYLAEHPEQQLAQPPMSSWGAGGTLGSGSTKATTDSTATCTRLPSG